MYRCRVRSRTLPATHENHQLLELRNESTISRSHVKRKLPLRGKKDFLINFNQQLSSIVERFVSVPSTGESLPPFVSEGTLGVDTMNNRYHLIGRIQKQQMIA